MYKEIHQLVTGAVIQSCSGKDVHLKFEQNPSKNLPKEEGVPSLAFFKDFCIGFKQFAVVFSLFPKFAIFTNTY